MKKRASSKKKLKLPSRKALKKSTDTVHNFREFCKHQMELGYWATIDFPSKHHVNNILQLQYRNRTDLLDFYGTALTEAALELVPTCKSYLEFLRGAKSEEVENPRHKDNSR